MLPLCMTPTNSAQNRAVVFSVNKSLFARTTNLTRLTFTTTTLRGSSSNNSRSSVAGRFSRRSSSLNSSSALGKKMVNFAVNEADGEAEDDRDEEAFETDEERRFSAAFSSSSSSFKNDDGGFQRQRRTGRRRRKLKNSLDFEDDIEEEDVGTGRGRREETEDGDDYDERRRGRGDGRRGQRERERRRRRSSSSSSSSSSYSPALPNVTLLTNGETEKCLPIAATSNQYGYFWGTTDAAVQRVAISLLGVVLCSTINDFEIGTALQVPFATFFLWAPIALAARRNAAARAGEFVGLWRARVKDIEVVPVVAKTFENARKKSSSRRNTRKTTSEMLLIDFIDPISSFEVSFRIPNERRYDDVQIGDACELIVSSDDDLFRNFVAIREAYVPELDVWVGEYPFLDRNGFVLVSKRVSNN